MSGFVAVVGRSEATPPGRLLADMVRILAFRGPDRTDIWSDETAALGYSHLDTRTPGECSCQPLFRNGRYRIVCDGRLDGREDLRAELTTQGLEDSSGLSNAELVLSAFRVWGTACTSHLLGDFAFAIWDSEQRSLFCARDRFGIKPLFFARTRDGVIAGSDVLCLLRHPEVSKALNEQFIGDFLLFGFNQQPDTTVYRDIHQLAPASCLEFSAGTLKIRRYWKMEPPEPLRYRNSCEYPEHFRELFSRAIRDRLPEAPVAVLMSGGLDSTAVASVAHDFARSSPFPLQVHAFTIYYQDLFADPERHFAEAAALHAGFPLHLHCADSYRLFQNWDQPEMATPQPFDEPLSAMTFDLWRNISQSGIRVVLTAYGGDVGFHLALPQFLQAFLTRGEWKDLIREFARYTRAFRRLPPLRFSTRLLRLSKRFSGSKAGPVYPPWIQPDFERRMNLKERWSEVWSVPRVESDPARPHPYRFLQDPCWLQCFESCDPAFTGHALDVRHPFFDLRVLKCLLAFPPIPWVLDKEVLRETVRGLLPEPVRLRPKTPLQGNPLHSLIERDGLRALGAHRLCPQALCYIDPVRLGPLFNPAVSADPVSSSVRLRPLALDYWLRSAGRSIMPQ